MKDVTRILEKAEQGDPAAAEELLPLVYAELRRLAAARISCEAEGHTLQATALVHEAYIRLVDCKTDQNWNSRGHFFAAAAEAMRRILVESARRKARDKHGGGLNRRELISDVPEALSSSAEILSVHEGLAKLEAENIEAANLVKLRYFGGFTIPETAEAMQISPRKANQIWAYARAWLAAAIGDEQES